MQYTMVGTEHCVLLTVYNTMVNAARGSMGTITLLKWADLSSMGLCFLGPTHVTWPILEVSAQLLPKPNSWQLGRFRWPAVDGRLSHAAGPSVMDPFDCPNWVPVDRRMLTSSCREMVVGKRLALFWGYVLPLWSPRCDGCLRREFLFRLASASLWGTSFCYVRRFATMQPPAHLARFMHAWHTDFCKPLIADSQSICIPLFRTAILWSHPPPVPWMPTDETRPMDSSNGKPSRKCLSEDGSGGNRPVSIHCYSFEAVSCLDDQSRHLEWNPEHVTVRLPLLWL